ncbi:MAG: hypothetical protein HPY69_00400 [Armatimonadetes bacterium]|nr:hypothetical protein [Armatimonadota bacterium]
MTRTVYWVLVVSVSLLVLVVGPVHSDSISVWVDGQFVGWALELTEGRSYVPLRSVSQALGVPVQYSERFHCVFLGITVGDGVTTGSVVRGSAGFPTVYVDGSLVGVGAVISGVTYVPLRLVSERLGATVDYVPQVSKIRVTSRGGTPAPLLPGVPIAHTVERWWPVEESGWGMWFRNAVISGTGLSAEIRIDEGVFKKTPKPISVDFVVTLYGWDGTAIAQDSVRLYGISSAGGRYLLETITLIGGEVASCSVVYSSAWVPRR